MRRLRGTGPTTATSSPRTSSTGPHCPWRNASQGECSTDRIWNGFDSSTGKATPYDNEAIFTGSAVVVDGAGPGGVPGVVHVYPGLCNKQDWPSCSTGTLLAQAVPFDYENDELLVNWTKPSYNPIMESTQRDPSTPWKDPKTGEWRLRTYDAMVYGSASDKDLPSFAGHWPERMSTSASPTPRSSQSEKPAGRISPY